jgi:hypothetical protein
MANPPPPYDNITGISRTVMKDNAQETLSNYNGNARPGEIVADLTTDPPALYIGNNLGELTAITSGSSYGNANVVTLLATFGSNTISTTGNITGGNIETTGYLSANSIGVSASVTAQTVVTDPVNLGSLTAVFGARAFILDGNLAAAGNFGANVSGGGGNSVPVWSDGTNWYIG